VISPQAKPCNVHGVRQFHLLLLAVERDCSKLQVIKTDHRNRLKNETFVSSNASLTGWSRTSRFSFRESIATVACYEAQKTTKRFYE
jgi:hypothetical protein